MSQISPKPEVLYDTRLIERHIRRGLITREQAQKHAKDLPDVADKGEVLDLEVMQNEIESRTQHYS